MDRLERIKSSVARRDDWDAMTPVCGEYTCPCHYDVPYLLERLAKRDEYYLSKCSELRIVEKMNDELENQLARVKGETFKAAIDIARRSAKKSQAASLDIASAEILIRRLEAAAKEGA